MIDLESVTEQMAAIVGNIGEEQLAGPTPLDRMNVADLLTHVLGLTVAFRDAAAKLDGPTTDVPPEADGADLPTDWRYSILQRLNELNQAWRAPQAWQGQTRVGGIEMPGQNAGFVLNNELVLHGWDLAVSTDQPFAVAAENLQASWQFVVNTPDDPAAREGLFGPRIPIAEDAPLLDRTLAYAGRDPRWVPWS
jgi:uncharacterized protein (TIGR03086 family)